MTLTIWVAKTGSVRRSEWIKTRLTRRKREGCHISRKKGTKGVKKRDYSGYFRRYHGSKITSVEVKA